MNYNYLKYFKVLAETEHYTHAASILNISQPSLSHAINQLENELGLYLFEKQGRNIKLTKYGQIYYNYINNGLNEIEHGTSVIESLASQDNGTIDLGFIYTLGSYYIPNIISSFLKENKNIKFTLHQSASLDIIRDLKNETLDVGFCSFIEEEADHINYIPVVDEELVVIVSNNHPLSKYDEIDITTLKDEEWIYYSKNSGIRPLIDKTMKQYKISPKINCEVEEDSAVFGLVDINYGIAIVPKLKALQLFNVKALKITNKIDERHIYLATLKNRYLPPSVTKFTSYLLHNSFSNHNN